MAGRQKPLEGWGKATEAMVRVNIGRNAAFGLLAAITLLSACNRNKLVLTECLGDVPAKPRIEDVAPPNCGTR